MELNFSSHSCFISFLKSLFLCFLFQQGNQLIQVGGGNFNTIQPMQTVTVDGQEALFIPSAPPQNQHQTLQVLAGQTLITPNGQIIRGPSSVVPQYNTIQLPFSNGKQIEIE